MGASWFGQSLRVEGSCLPGSKALSASVLGAIWGKKNGISGTLHVYGYPVLPSSSLLA